MICTTAAEMLFYCLSSVESFDSRIYYVVKSGVMHDITSLK